MRLSEFIRLLQEAAPANGDDPEVFVHIYGNVVGTPKVISGGAANRGRVLITDDGGDDLFVGNNAQGYQPRSQV